MGKGGRDAQAERGACPRLVGVMVGSLAWLFLGDETHMEKVMEILALC